MRNKYFLISALVKIDGRESTTTRALSEIPAAL